MIEQRIRTKSKCSGCHACANICPGNCIAMIQDQEGFRYPKVDASKCIRCRKCIDTCPIINKSVALNTPTAYACQNNDERIRLQSSSGGMFTLFAEKTLERHGAVFGAAFDDGFQLAHRCVETKKGLEVLRGSKYVESLIGKAYTQARTLLETGRAVLFSGTPCQIEGLRAFLGKSYTNLLTIDLICHGVPSHAVWEQYIRFREARAGVSVKRIDFRRKDPSWKLFCISILYQNNTHYRAPLDQDPYMRTFLKNCSLRPSCYACKFKGLNRLSDITLADFWGIQNILPEMDDDKGTSLVLVNTGTGASAFNAISSNAKTKRVEISDAICYNSAAMKSAAMNPNREKFFTDLQKVGFDRLAKRYCSEQRRLRIRRKAKALLKRLLKKLG